MSMKMKTRHCTSRGLPVQLTDNIAITPGAIWITANFNNDNVVIERSNDIHFCYKKK